MQPDEPFATAATTELEASAGTFKSEAVSVESAAQRIPEAAPAVWMDQRGNYWRVYPKETLPGADEDTLSICPTSSENYDSEPVAIYRQGRDLSMKEMEELRGRIGHATDDLLLNKAAQNAWEAWTTGRDMVTEAELLMQMIAIRLGVKEGH